MKSKSNGTVRIAAAVATMTTTKAIKPRPRRRCPQPNANADATTADTKPPRDPHTNSADAFSPSAATPSIAYRSDASVNRSLNSNDDPSISVPVNADNRHASNPSDPAQPMFKNRAALLRLIKPPNAARGTSWPSGLNDGIAIMAKPSKATTAGPIAKPDTRMPTRSRL